MAVTNLTRDCLEDCVQKLNAALQTDTGAESTIQAVSDTLRELCNSESSTEDLRPSYADLYENSPDMLCSVDVNTSKIIRCNRTMASMLGRSKQDIVGHSVFDVYHPDCWDRVNEVCKQFASTGEIRDEELQLIGPNHAKIDVLLNATAVRDAQGNILSSRSSFRDITERRRAEQQSQASERRLRAILDAEPACVKLTDRDANLLEVNAAGLGMLDADSTDQVVGQCLLPLLDPDFREPFLNLTKRVFQGEAGTLEFSGTSLKGSHKWLESHASPLRDARGVVTAMLSVTRDVTERKQAELALRKSEERLQLFIAHAPAALAMLDLQMRYLAVSERWLADFHLTGQSIIGQSHYDVFPEIPERWKELHRRTLTGEVLRSDEDRFERADGSVQWLCWEIRPWHAADGTIGGMVIFSEDITDRKLAEEELRDSRSRLQLLIRSSNIGLWDWNLKTNEVYFSSEWKRQLGYADDEISNRFEEWQSRVHPDDREPTMAAVRDFLSGKRQEYQVEFRIRHRDGSWRWIFTRADLQRDASGEPARMMGCHIDITERKRTEEALRESERRYRAIVEDQSEFIVRWQPNGVRTYVNDAYCRCFGKPREELLGTSFFPLVSESDRAEVEARLEALTPANPISNDSHQVILPHGEIGWQQWTDRALFDDHGQLVGYQSIGRDITDQRKAEEALRESEEKFSAAFRSSPLPLIIGTLNGTIVEANQAFCELFGYTRDEVIGNSAVDLGIIDQAQREGLTLAIERAGGSLRNYELPMRVRDGSLRDIVFSVQPITFQRIPHHLATGVDVTARNKAEEALRASREALSELNVSLERRVAERTAELQDKNTELEAFAQTVSHDLRAPLRAMEGFAMALEEDFGDRLDNAGHRYIGHIRDSAQRMDALVADLLAYSRLGQTELHIAAVDLDAAVADVIQHLESDTKQCGAQIDVVGPLPAVLAHRATLIQIVTNLLTNAVKFVATGVRPSVRIWAEQGNQGSVRLWVEDNGIGVEGEYQSRIFRVFERLHGIESYPGTGVGLAIVARGCSRLGGRCGVESQKNHGSRFWIELPAAKLTDDRC